MLENHPSAPLSTMLAADRHSGLLDAVEQSMLVAQFDLSGRILAANANFLALMGYAASDLNGAHHRCLCEPAYAGSREYLEHWARLARGERFSSRCRRRTRSGETVWLDATYGPIHGEDGELCAVLKIARDATHEERRDADLRLLSLAVDSTDNAVILLDGLGRILYVNEGFVRMAGYRRDEVRGRRLVDVVPVASAESLEGCQALKGLARRVIHDDLLISDRQGGQKWVSLVSTPTPEGMSVVLTDITHTKVHEVMQRKVLQALVDERPLADIMALTCREVERLTPDVYATVTQLGEDGMLRVVAAPSFPASYTQAVGAHPVGPNAASSGRAAHLGQPVLVKDTLTDPIWADFRPLAHKMGTRSCWSMPILHTDGHVLGTFALHSRKAFEPDQFHKDLAEISARLCALALEREEARARIRRLAYYDALTGLPNRSLFGDRATYAIEAAARQESMLALIFIDLDRFKQVNDSLGHAAGDALLREVGQRLRMLAGPAEICGRFSGDEFVLMLPVPGREALCDVGEHVRSALALPLLADSITLVPSASLGIAMFPEHGRDLDTLLRHADVAMYQAKMDGRAQARVYELEMDRTALEAALSAALERGDEQLTLAYQPQVNLQRDALYGVEALLRWQHPHLGSIPPDRFVPLAEECGLIGRLGDWVLNRACGQLANWRMQGVPVPAISVNLSPIDFKDPALPARIGAVLERYGLKPSDLIIELTEGVFMDVTPPTSDIVEAVDALGVRLSVDDFGTGYASLAQLRQIPVSELKLDRSFVSDLESDPVARSLARTVVNMGRSLDLAVVAEGVETPGQLAFLEDCGCTAVQGYLYSPGLAPDDLAAWIFERYHRR